MGFARSFWTYLAVEWLGWKRPGPPDLADPATELARLGRLEREIRWLDANLDLWDLVRRRAASRRPH